MPETQPIVIPPTLAQWKCHKVVRAARIADASEDGDQLRLVLDPSHCAASSTSYVITVAREGGLSTKSAAAMVGGYLVQYEDGYLSWSPRASFETGYSRLPENRVR